ncbi:MAG: hypothetical protein IKI52_05035 [Clostridia bacterium]|nr:hypothetical protein [Clostridia bacterium]
MNVRESDYRASQKYQKEKCRKITLLLNKKIDEDLLVWLDSQENKSGYLKKLIREDMARQGFEMPEKKE